ncbi:CLIP domain-containing serine protease HP8 isoform X1 [Amyelois transitella]|uniref:CLIP domain-containing serine protease HP8 isoform X1 n=1 Tax=Amyelois transitella TaxID=680683 RepID=UPI00298FCF75|nr:CLIP domain-containing serine protease HP8 isoform X1 [Amyelois transitella]
MLKKDQQNIVKFSKMIGSGSRTMNDLYKVHTVQDVSNHPAWSKLEHYECGDSAADRIIGGVNAALGQYPWIARLGYKVSDDPDLDWMCGGAIVTDQHVLTAAHCVTTPEDDYTLQYVRLGEHDDRQDPDCVRNICAPKIQDRKVKKATIHPLYNKPLFHNDIAIIELDQPLDIHNYVAPICLPRNEEQMSILKMGDMVTVAGWGKTNMTTQHRANILQTLKLPVVDQNACSNFGSAFSMTDSEICAGAQFNRDACGGDSGGPLMKVFDTMDGPKNFLVGIVSFGPTICGTTKPGVYTSVPHFMNWILDNLI